MPDLQSTANPDEAAMHLSVTRLDERRYETVVRRRDGVRYHVKGIGHMFAIPHDMAHLAIEVALGLRHGFWGSVADGAVFESMTYLDGRRKPRAAERSREVLRANHGSIAEAEYLIRIFNDALEQGHGPQSAELRARLRDHTWTAPGHAPRRLTDAEVAAACAAWERLLERWRALPVGGTLELAWPEEEPLHRGSRPPRRAAHDGDATAARRPAPRPSRRRRW